MWNWRKCLRRLCHWHCKRQVPEHKTSISHKKLVELTPETIQTSNLCLLTSHTPGNHFPWYLSTLQLPLAHWKAYYTCLCSKYLDHNRRLAQCMSWSPYPEPSHIWKPRDLIYVSGSWGLTRDSIYELTAFWLVNAMAGNPMHHLQLSTHRKSPFHINPNTTIPTSIYFQSTQHVYKPLMHSRPLC